ncbi:hypothetical protein B0H13DRAFT_1851242 [Mycena leptocephala]|nr:hypothetical protein B0H13DRAFT_1851242 [Mycena leptocephala]
MDTSRAKLRPLLPRSPSQTRPEPFLINGIPSANWCTVANSQSAVGSQSINPDASANTIQMPHTKFDRRSRGQKKRREREAKENQHKDLAAINLNRSTAQRAKRQRELAANIENLCARGHRDRSRAQILRRRVEKAEKCLEHHPDCDPTHALDRALDLEYDVNEAQHRDRHRESYRRRIAQLYEGNKYNIGNTYNVLLKGRQPESGLMLMICWPHAAIDLLKAIILSGRGNLGCTGRLTFSTDAFFIAHERRLRILTEFTSYTGERFGQFTVLDTSSLAGGNPMTGGSTMTATYSHVSQRVPRFFFDEWKQHDQWEKFKWSDRTTNRVTQRPLSIGSHDHRKSSFRFFPDEWKEFHWSNRTTNRVVEQCA